MASMSLPSSAKTLRPPTYQESEPEVFRFLIGSGTHKEFFYISYDNLRRHSALAFPPDLMSHATLEVVEVETFQIFHDFIENKSNPIRMPSQIPRDRPIHISVKAWVLGEGLGVHTFRDEMMKRVSYYYNPVNSSSGQPSHIWKVTPELVEYLCIRLEPTDLLWKFFTDLAAQSFFATTYPGIVEEEEYYSDVSTVDWGKFIPWRWVVTRKRFPAWEEALFADSITLPEASAAGLSALRNNLTARKKRSKTADAYI